MAYSIEPAFTVASVLARKLTLAGMNIENQWFFSDGAFIENEIVDRKSNIWINENFVVIEDNMIIAYFNATWNRPLDIISSFRLILFDKKKSILMAKAFFEYLDYLFIKRGCKAFNWTVAEKNKHAYLLYEKFIHKYMGHKIGKRHYSQKSYTGLISNSILYDITHHQYMKWKKDI